ncbi:MAG: LLM class F420-dependent oxidoreductase [Proteobacteria bacterium]|nr:LLM class F420-dependent oxidoreductase [Pseudomonadota bacterium]
MKIGTFATFMSPTSTPEMIADFGHRAEEAGLDSIWMGEHVVLFDEMEFPYPGSPDGKIPAPPGGGLLDTVSTFGFLAAETKKLRFGTGITLVPQRNPVYTAKEFATLDWLSGGRMDFGIGVGWCKEEVITCGYDWGDRGERCDEFLEVIQAFWTQEKVTYHGKHVNIEGAKMDPKPIQKPHVPIIVGGHSKAGMRRAARFGAGWYGFNLTPDVVEQILPSLDAALEGSGKKRGENFELVITPIYKVDDDMVRAYRDLGVDRLVIQQGSQKPEKITARLAEMEAYVNVAA